MTRRYEAFLRRVWVGPHRARPAHRVGYEAFLRRVWVGPHRARPAHRVGYWVGAGMLLAASVTARASTVAAPGAWEALRRSLEPSSVSYEGRLRVETFSGGKSRSQAVAVRYDGGRYRSEVLDRSGRASLLVVRDGKVEWIYDPARRRAWAGAGTSVAGLGREPEEEFARLASEYEAAISTAGKVAGRPAWLLALRDRSDGSLRRLLWVDQKHGLVLQSRDFRPDGTSAFSRRFTRIVFPARQAQAHFAFSPPSGAEVGRRLEPEGGLLVRAREESGLEPRLARWLPAGFFLESLGVMPQGRRKLLHYRYSDGANALSLFQCPPRSRLDMGAKPSEKVRLLGRVSASLAWTEEGPALAWSWEGDKFLLVGPLPREDLRRVAESLVEGDPAASRPAGHAGSGAPAIR